jgi:hypothetical protein
MAAVSAEIGLTDLWLPLIRVNGRQRRIGGGRSQLAE